MKKKGFTLIEMLIVIVIIGILAAALIPRISSARGKANDAARKSAIHNISTALSSYNTDFGEYPQGCGPLQTALGDKLKDYDYPQQLLPTDPQSSNTWSFAGIASMTGYYYCSTKNGFILAAHLEGNGGNITGTYTQNDIQGWRSSDVGGYLGSGCDANNACNIYVEYQ